MRERLPTSSKEALQSFKCSGSGRRAFEIEYQSSLGALESLPSRKMNAEAQIQHRVFRR